MKVVNKLAVAGVAVSALSFIAPVVQAASNTVVIGDIDDMSGLYADVIGPGGVEAAKMAIDDFGGTVLGNKIESWSRTIRTSPISDRRNSGNGRTAMA
jgi:branched-chain amino acid transport system substrate-binding protein